MSLEERINNYKQQFRIENCDQEFYLKIYCEFQEMYDNLPVESRILKKEILYTLFELKRVLNLE